MLAALRQHFSPDRTERGNGAVRTPDREPLDIHHGPCLQLELPEVGNLPHRLAVNGASTDGEGVGGYAAVTGSGRVVVGYFTCPTVNVQIAEIQAVRFGLRELDTGRAEVLLANAMAADALGRIAAGNRVPYINSLADRNGIRDIARSTRRLDVQVRPIPSGRTDHLLPDHPLLGIASRLSLAACRLAVHGVPFDAITREWLRRVGSRSGRRRYSLQCRCDRFIARRNRLT